MLNNVNSQKYEIDIFIINPFQTQEPNENITFDITNPAKSNAVIQTANSNVANDKRIDFELDKESYYTREKVNLKLKYLTETIEKGNYSVSIRKTDQIPTLKQLTASEFAKKTTENYVNTPNSLNYIPEIRSELITGNLTAKNNRDIANKSIALSLPGKEYVLKL